MTGTGGQVSIFGVGAPSEFVAQQATVTQPVVVTSPVASQSKASQSTSQATASTATTSVTASESAIAVSPMTKFGLTQEELDKVINTYKMTPERVAELKAQKDVIDAARLEFQERTGWMSAGVKTIPSGPSTRQLTYWNEIKDKWEEWNKPNTSEIYGDSPRAKMLQVLQGKYVLTTEDWKNDPLFAQLAATVGGTGANVAALKDIQLGITTGRDLSAGFKQFHGDYYKYLPTENAIRNMTDDEFDKYVKGMMTPIYQDRVETFTSTRRTSTGSGGGGGGGTQVINIPGGGSFTVTTSPTGEVSTGPGTVSGNIGISALNPAAHQTAKSAGYGTLTGEQVKQLSDLNVKYLIASTEGKQDEAKSAVFEANKIYKAATPINVENLTEAKRLSYLYNVASTPLPSSFDKSYESVKASVESAKVQLQALGLPVASDTLTSMQGIGANTNLAAAKVLSLQGYDNAASAIGGKALAAQLLEESKIKHKNAIIGELRAQNPTLDDTAINALYESNISPLQVNEAAKDYLSSLNIYRGNLPQFVQNEPILTAKAVEYNVGTIDGRKAFQSAVLAVINPATGEAIPGNPLGLQGKIFNTAIGEYAPMTATTLQINKPDGVAYVFRDVSDPLGSIIVVDQANKGKVESWASFTNRNPSLSTRSEVTVLPELAGVAKALKELGIDPKYEIKDTATLKFWDFAVPADTPKYTFINDNLVQIKIGDKPYSIAEIMSLYPNAQLPKTLADTVNLGFGLDIAPTLITGDYAKKSFDEIAGNIQFALADPNIEQNKSIIRGIWNGAISKGQDPVAAINALTKNDKIINRATGQALEGNTLGLKGQVFQYAVDENTNLVAPKTLEGFTSKYKPTTIAAPYSGIKISTDGKVVTINGEVLNDINAEYFYNLANVTLANDPKDLNAQNIVNIVNFGKFNIDKNNFNSVGFVSALERDTRTYPNKYALGKSTVSPVTPTQEQVQVPEVTVPTVQVSVKVGNSEYALTENNAEAIYKGAVATLGSNPNDLIAQSIVKMGREHFGNTGEFNSLGFITALQRDIETYPNKYPGSTKGFATEATKEPISKITKITPFPFIGRAQAAVGVDIKPSDESKSLGVTSITLREDGNIEAIQLENGTNKVYVIKPDGKWNKYNSLEDAKKGSGWGVCTQDTCTNENALPAYAIIKDANKVPGMRIATLEVPTGFVFSAYDTNDYTKQAQLSAGEILAKIPQDKGVSILQFGYDGCGGCELQIENIQAVLRDKYGFNNPNIHFYEINTNSPMGAQLTKADNAKFATTYAPYTVIFIDGKEYGQRKTGPLLQVEVENVLIAANVQPYSGENSKGEVPKPGYIAPVVTPTPTKETTTAEWLPESLVKVLNAPPLVITKPPEFNQGEKIIFSNDKGTSYAFVYNDWKYIAHQGDDGKWGLCNGVGCRTGQWNSLGDVLTTVRNEGDVRQNYAKDAASLGNTKEQIEKGIINLGNGEEFSQGALEAYDLRPNIVAIKEEPTPSTPTVTIPTPAPVISSKDVPIQFPAGSDFVSLTQNQYEKARSNIQDSINKGLISAEGQFAGIGKDGVLHFITKDIYDQSPQSYKDVFDKLGVFGTVVKPTTITIPAPVISKPQIVAALETRTVNLINKLAQTPQGDYTDLKIRLGLAQPGERATAHTEGWQGQLTNDEVTLLSQVPNYMDSSNVYPAGHPLAGYQRVDFNNLADRLDTIKSQEIAAIKAQEQYKVYQSQLPAPAPFSTPTVNVAKIISDKTQPIFDAAIKIVQDYDSGKSSVVPTDQDRYYAGIATYFKAKSAGEKINYYSAYEQVRNENKYPIDISTKVPASPQVVQITPSNEVVIGGTSIGKADIQVMPTSVSSGGVSMQPITGGASKLVATPTASLTSVDPYRTADGRWDIAKYALDMDRAGLKKSEIRAKLLEIPHDNYNWVIEVDKALEFIPSDELWTTQQYLNADPFARNEYNKLHNPKDYINSLPANIPHPSIIEYYGKVYPGTDIIVDPRSVESNLYYDLAIRTKFADSDISKAGISVAAFVEQFSDLTRVPTLVLGENVDKALANINITPYTDAINKASVNSLTILPRKSLGQTIGDKYGLTINHLRGDVKGEEKAYEKAINEIREWETYDQLKEQIINLMYPKGGHAELTDDPLVEGSARAAEQVIGFVKMFPEIPITLAQSYNDAQQKEFGKSLSRATAMGASFVLFPLSATGQELGYIGEGAEKGKWGSAVGFPVGIAMFLGASKVAEGVISGRIDASSPKAAFDPRMLRAENFSIQGDIPRIKANWLTPEATREAVNQAMYVITQEDAIPGNMSSRAGSDLVMRLPEGQLTIRMSPFMRAVRRAAIHTDENAGKVFSDAFNNEGKFVSGGATQVGGFYMGMHKWQARQLGWGTVPKDPADLILLYDKSDVKTLPNPVFDLCMQGDLTAAKQQLKKMMDDGTLEQGVYLPFKWHRDEHDIIELEVWTPDGYEMFAVPQERIPWWARKEGENTAVMQINNLVDYHEPRPTASQFKDMGYKNIDGKWVDSAGKEWQPVEWKVGDKLPTYFAMTKNAIDNGRPFPTLGQMYMSEAMATLTNMRKAMPWNRGERRPIASDEGPAVTTPFTSKLTGADFKLTRATKAGFTEAATTDAVKASRQWDRYDVYDEPTDPVTGNWLNLRMPVKREVTSVKPWDEGGLMFTRVEIIAIDDATGRVAVGHTIWDNAPQDVMSFPGGGAHVPTSMEGKIGGRQIEKYIPPIISDNYGASPLSNAIQQLKEEAGLIADPSRTYLLGVYPGKGKLYGQPGHRVYVTRVIGDKTIDPHRFDVGGDKPSSPDALVEMDATRWLDLRNADGSVYPATYDQLRALAVREPGLGIDLSNLRVFEGDRTFDMSGLLGKSRGERFAEQVRDGSVITEEKIREVNQARQQLRQERYMSKLSERGGLVPEGGPETLKTRIQRQQARVVESYNEMKNIGVVADARVSVKQQTQLYRDLIELAKLYIEKGATTLAEFANMAGLKINDVVNHAWEAAQNKEGSIKDYNKLPDASKEEMRNGIYLEGKEAVSKMKEGESEILPYRKPKEVKEMGDYPKETPYAKEKAYPLVTPYPTEAPYPSEKPYPKETPYSKVSVYPKETPYPSESRYPSVAPYPKESPYPKTSPYPSEAPVKSPYPPSIIPTKPVITPSIPPIKVPPIIIKTKHGEVVATQEKLEGAVAWKQGIMYIAWVKPFTQRDLLYTRKPIPGVKYFEGPGSAAKSIVATYGEVPDFLHADMGIVDVNIKGQGRNQPILTFREDKYVSRRGRRSVKAPKSSIIRSSDSFGGLK